MDEKKFEDLMYRTLTRFYQNVLLPKFATKEDLEPCATKEDLEKIGNDVKRLDVRMENLEDKVSSMERTLWKVTDHQAKKLDDHEKRIAILEG